jgi:hypothetical protein
MKTRRQRFWAGLGLLLLVLVIGYVAMRPFHLRWGASDAEVAAAMPGDLGGRSWTRAITVNATPAQIWPWLAQWGQGRGGWYSYDWLENLLGFQIHTATRILPEFQNPRVGDPICMAPAWCMNEVSVVEPNRWFGWQAKDPGGAPVWTFTLGLAPVDAAATRLIVRESFAAGAMPAPALVAIEIPDVVMELKMLDTVKQRAEGYVAPPLATAFEIAAWLAVFAVCVVAFVQFVRRGPGPGPLLVALLAAIVLLAFTFLYPPLWLRGGVGVVGVLGAVALARPSTNERMARIAADATRTS